MTDPQASFTAMPLTTLHIVLTLCLALSVFILPATSGMAQNLGEPVHTKGMSEARELLQAGRHDAALDILRPLSDDRDARTDALFILGLAAIGAALQPGRPDEERDILLDEAIAAFEAILVERPGLVRVRLELARALFLKGEDRLAEEQFRLILAGDLPPAVVVNVNRFLIAIRDRRRWTASFGFSIVPDSNVGSRSDDRTIEVQVLGQTLPFHRSASDLPGSGIGVSAWAGWEHVRPLGDGLQLQTGGSISRTEYKGSRFDRMSLSAHLGPRWLVGNETEVGLFAVATQRWVGSSPDHHDLGLRLEVDHRLSHRMSADLRISRLERHDHGDAKEGGPVTDLSLGTRYLLTPTLQAVVSLGWSREHPARVSYRNTTRRVLGGLNAALPGGWTVGATAQLRRTDWEGDWFPFVPDGRSRKDRVQNLRLSAHHRGTTVAGFSPHLAVTFERQASNARLHNYRRTAGELSFVRAF